MGLIPFNLNINLLHRFSVTFSFLRRLQIVSPFFKQHILSLDTVRVIISRQNLAIVDLAIVDFSHIFLQNNITMATILGISLSLKINMLSFLKKREGEIFPFNVTRY